MKNNKNTVRSLKVYARFNDTPSKINEKIPEIRLKGNWLKKWGFDSGKNIKVLKTEYGIIISNNDAFPPIVVL